jgi:hypothetical protein
MFRSIHSSSGMTKRNVLEIYFNVLNKIKLLPLTLNLLTTTIVAPLSNASKWQMRFNSVFKGLNVQYI